MGETQKYIQKLKEELGSDKRNEYQLKGILKKPGISDDHDCDLVHHIS